MSRNRFLILLIIPALLLAGCATVNRRDRAILREHGVSQDVYDKMTYGDPLSLEDVIELSHRDVPDGLIIHYMNETDAAYRLRKADVQHLRSAGVSEQVIAYMLSTAPPYGPGVYPGAYPLYPYPYGPYPYYFYDGPYLGPVFFGGWGWGGGWRGHGGGWHGGGGRHR